MRILAIDPGKVSGWCVLDDGDFTSGELQFKELGYQLESIFDWTVDQAIVERYSITIETVKKSRQTDSLEVTGMVRYFADRQDAAFNKSQTPADAKAMGTDERLRAMGWYTKGMAGHANDAARHLFLWCTANGYITWKGDVPSLKQN